MINAETVYSAAILDATLYDDGRQNTCPIALCANVM
jgi:hypothetical protein